MYNTALQFIAYNSLKSELRNFRQYCLDNSKSFSTKKDTDITIPKNVEAALKLVAGPMMKF